MSLKGYSLKELQIISRGKIETLYVPVSSGILSVLEILEERITRLERENMEGTLAAPIDYPIPTIPTTNNGQYDLFSTTVE